MLSNDLTWRAHVDYVLKKANSLLHALRELRRAGLSQSDLLSVYCSLQLVSLYGLPCLQHYLTILSSALRIIYPELSYMDALAVTDLDTLVNPRHDCCMKFVSKLRECKSLNFNPLVSIVKEVSYEPVHQYNLRIKEYRMIFRAG